MCLGNHEVIFISLGPEKHFINFVIISYSYAGKFTVESKYIVILPVIMNGIDIFKGQSRS